MIYRTYECFDCRTTFEVICESGEDGDPDCPVCSRVLEWKPGGFNIKTNRSRAVDVTQEIMETDYGLTNFKEAPREGDVSAIMPSETTSERENRLKAEHELVEMAMQTAPANPQMEQAVKGFWGGGGQGVAANPIAAQTLMASAKAGPAADVISKDSPFNPMGMLHKAGRAGQLPFRFRVVARG